MSRWTARTHTLLTSALLVGVGLGQAVDAPAQTRPISEAECQSLRQRLGEHARLSEGVRRAVAAKAATSPAAPAAAPSPAPVGRAEAIRARLEQIPKERQTLEDQRLAAMVKFELNRAAQFQAQIQALDAERTMLERERAALPPASGAPAAAPAAPPAAPDAARIRCEEMPAALDSALKTRRRELGAREDQAGAIPLTGLTGQTNDQIAQDLAAQFAPGPAAMAQVGLLDVDGDGRLDGFVDVPAPSSFRLVRQRADGSMSVEVFAAPGTAAPAYGEMTRRLDEATARQTGQTVADMVATRQAGPARAVTQTSEFAQAHQQFAAGNFADAGRISAPAAHSADFQNLRGESVRVIEIISPVTGGVSVRRVVVLQRPNDQEQWEETTTIVRPVSYWRSDVEVARSRETRTTAGAPVGARSAGAPVKFTVER